MTAIKPATFQEAIDYLELSQDGSIEHRIAILLKGHEETEAERVRGTNRVVDEIRKESETAITELTSRLRTADNINLSHRSAITNLNEEVRRLKAHIAKLEGIPAPGPVDEERAKYAEQLQGIYRAHESDPNWQSAPSHKKEQFANDIMRIAKQINDLNNKGLSKNAGGMTAESLRDLHK